MSSIQLTEDQHVRHIVDVLTGEFEGRFGSEHIADEAERTYIDLREHSRVESFVPILALRRARASLSAEAERADRQGLPEEGPLVEPAEHELRRPGDVVHLVDGPFEIARAEADGDHVHYYGHWLDDGDS
jgi:hypothetical protein